MTVVEIVCFIRARALNHRQFKSFLDDLGSVKGDVLLHAEVRWLSRGKVLQRFYELLPEIRTFLTTKNKQYDELSDMEWLLNLAFLTDITNHLNTLNLKLQGEGKVLPVMYQHIEAFQRKLTLLGAHVSSQNFLQFPTLAKVVAESDGSYVACRRTDFREFIDSLAREFEQRFIECHSAKKLFNLIINPFAANPDELDNFVEVEDIASAQLELLELQSDVYLSTSADVIRSDCISMWKAINSTKQYVVLSNIAMKCISMFGSTYRCETAFSAMKGIKSKDRNRISDEHLVHCMRVATTQYQPLYT